MFPRNGASALAQPSPPPDPSKATQVLILTGQHVHDWRGTTPILKRDPRERPGRFEVRVNEEFRGAGPETLAPYDLVVVNYYNRSATGIAGARSRERRARGLRAIRARGSCSITCRSAPSTAGPNTRR